MDDAAKLVPQSKTEDCRTSRFAVKRSAPAKLVLGVCLPTPDSYCDLKPKLAQFAVDARGASKRIFPAHLPDQRTQPNLDRRPTSQRPRLPAPIALKARAVPVDERLGTDDRENLQDRWKPSIQLDQEPTIIVREPHPTLHPTPQNDQLMAERRILGFKPQLRLERRVQQRKV
jgi:hypothetical protein